MNRVAPRIKALLLQGIAAGAFPSAAVWIAADGRHRATVAAGGVTETTLWDVASLTKPMVTVTLAMQGMTEGWLPDLDARLGGPIDADFTLRSLLGHRSGLAAHAEFAQRLDETDPGWLPATPSTRAAIERRLTLEVTRADPARGTLYSDLGYILLGWHLEQLRGEPLRRLTPFSWGLTEPPDNRRAYAPTGFCSWRKRRLYGEVNDTNTWALGGAAGHAGVFATADAVGDWALGMLLAAEGGYQACSAIDGGIVREFWDPGQRESGSSWVLGWDTPTPGASSAGTTVSANAVGHLGFTGTSVWIDRDQRLVIVLLTNRVDLGPNAQDRLRKFRPMFHDAVRELLATGA